MTREVTIELPRFHPKQQLAFDSPATDILYGGSTRCGKSYFVRRALIVWCSQIPGLQCDIFRLYLDDIIAEAMQSETGFPVLLSAWEREGLVKINQREIKFWNGSLIKLEHASDPSEVMLKHQGIGKHVRVFVESTQIDVSLIKWLSGWVTMSAEMKSRIPEELKGRFPRIIHVSNPIGKSAAYYRREYVKARAPYEIELVGEFTRQYIPALVEDNPSEDAEATRRRIGEIGDDAIADALLNANWDASIGDFFPQYSDDRHCVPDIYEIPKHLFKFRTFDWGSSDPFCCLWWFVSDGQAFMDNGTSRWFPRGSLVCYREWYGCDPKDQSKGNQMRNEDVARGIVERTLEDDCTITLTDSLPFQDRGMVKHGKKYLISDEFRENGIPLILANTARIYGWKQVRDRLIGKDGLPLIYFCRCCKFVREYLPALPRHPRVDEDAAESGESTHAADPVRYACATKPPVKDNPEDVVIDYRDRNQRAKVTDLISIISKPEKSSYVTRR